ncbi:hypothetical protein DFP72DRAFT_1162666 [Ephemerocybe angulata]|uniref:F-box domain-containing protein n=1 Tax=Ephemerocybe angulata TaxID=980116 RepID=A0A8H6IHT3_9AGAR|nr:hypothetical protein DFP72DRAFT_1162666 [Tulosesus angulatus]
MAQQPIISDGLSTLDPFDKVPDEILSEIFCTANGGIEVLRGLQPYSSIYRKFLPFTLSKVCHRWRVAAQSTPELWSYLNIVCRRGPMVASAETAEHRLRTYVEMCLARSGDHPLYLRFWSLPPDHIPASVITKIASASRRLQELWIDTPNDMVPISLLASSESFQGLPNLRSVRAAKDDYNTGPYNSNVSRRKPKALDTPVLTSLSVSSQGGAYSLIKSFTLANLTYLSLQEDSAWDLGQFADVLTRSPRLQHLRMTITITWSMSNLVLFPQNLTIHLPHLTTLAVEGGPASSWYLLKHIRSPSLTRLYISEKHDSTREDVYARRTPEATETFNEALRLLPKDLACLTVNSINNAHFQILLPTTKARKLVIVLPAFKRLEDYSQVHSFIQNTILKHATQVRELDIYHSTIFLPGATSGFVASRALYSIQQAIVGARTSESYTNVPTDITTNLHFDVPISQHSLNLLEELRNSLPQGLHLALHGLSIPRRSTISDPHLGEWFFLTLSSQFLRNVLFSIHAVEPPASPRPQASRRCQTNHITNQAPNTCRHGRLPSRINHSPNHFLAKTPSRTVWRQCDMYVHTRPD